MNVIMPCAGLGSRFTRIGYTFPKPLIPIQNMNGNPMIKVVIDNLNIDANYVFICKEEHEKMFHIKSVLEQTVEKCKTMLIDYTTEGSACTCLLGKKYINTDESLIIADCDHFPVWNSKDFLKKMESENIDGGTVVFPNSHPKFSYVKIDRHGFVTEVKEKIVVSNSANVGIYFWKRGSDFVKYARQMILKDVRVNNEFYSAPVFNEAIVDGKKILAYPIKKQWELGTPEDLEYFIRNYKP